MSYLGPELVVNGEFTNNDTGWTESGSSGWTNVAGKEKFESAGDGEDVLFQDIGVTPGKTYRVQFTISGWALTGTPTIKAILGGTEIAITGNVVYSEDVICGLTDTYIAFYVLQNDMEGEFYLDDVSVKEVLEGGRGINRLLMRDRIHVE